MAAFFQTVWQEIAGFFTTYKLITDTLDILLVALFVPVCGIGGYVAVVYVSEIINLAFSMVRLYHVTGVKPRMLYSITLPALGVILTLPLGHASLVGFLVLRFVLAGGIYLLFLLLVGCIGKEERELLGKTLRGG